MAQPHDSLFRAVFSRSEEVAAFLGLLAPELSGLRPEDLTPVPGTFIDEALRSRHTDALWRLAWRGRELLVYFLIEHQSTADRWMALRGMGYLARIWAAWRAEQGDATSLPPIVPVVLFHGDRPWEEPVDVADLVEIPPELVPWLGPLSPSVRVHVLDLSAASDAELRAGALLLDVALWSFKHIWDPDFFEHLEQWRDHLEALCQAPTGLQAVEQVIRYWMSAARHVPRDAGERLVRALPAPAQEAGMDSGRRAAERRTPRGAPGGAPRGTARSGGGDPPLGARDPARGTLRGGARRGAGAHRRRRRSGAAALAPGAGERADAGGGVPRRPRALEMITRRRGYLASWRRPR